MQAFFVNVKDGARPHGACGRWGPNVHPAQTPVDLASTGVQRFINQNFSIMHANIYQITERELPRSEFIDEYTFHDRLPDGADYTRTIPECEEEPYMGWLEGALKGVFERDGRELTFVGVEPFLEEWVAKIKESADGLFTEFFDSITLYQHKCLCERTHRNIASLIYSGERRQGRTENFGDFIQSLSYRNFKPGDKLYIGGIVDFHY